LLFLAIAAMLCSATNCSVRHLALREMRTKLSRSERAQRGLFLLAQRAHLRLTNNPGVDAELQLCALKSDQRIPASSAANLSP
jgi:hypothetical protein